MLKTLIIATVLLPTLAIGQRSQQQPQPRQPGQWCPVGWMPSGNYCVPGSDKALAAVSLLFASGGPPAAPGGNVTGMSAFATEPVGKRLELARELLTAQVIGYLVNPKCPNVDIETRLARDAPANSAR